MSVLAQAINVIINVNDGTRINEAESSNDHDIVRHFDMDDVDIHYHLHNHCALDCV